ncbi:MAG: MarR family winged helix-turn-helix transcriptional regulator [Gemmatimonadales bacterium]
MSRPLVQPPGPPRTDRSAIADRVHSAAIHLLRRLRKHDAATGLTAARLSALSVVVFGGPVTIGQLASAEQVSAPTMTRLSGAMERDGLVKRERDSRDARVVWLRATPKGGRLLRAGRRRRVAALAGELATLEPADVEHLARAADILERITGRLVAEPGTRRWPVPPAPEAPLRRPASSSGRRRGPSRE